MATISDALAAYRICAQAEGKSPKTVRWIMSSVGYFSEYLGDNQGVNTITANDLRGFIIIFIWSSASPVFTASASKLSNLFFIAVTCCSSCKAGFPGTQGYSSQGGG